MAEKSSPKKSEKTSIPITGMTCTNCAATIKKGLANMKIALGMVKTKRMHVGMPHKVKDTKGLQAILAKAAEIDARESKGGAQ